MTDTTTDIKTIATRTERLMVLLTDEERLAMGGQAAALELEIEQKEGERKDIMRRLREGLDSLKGRRIELARALNDGEEERDVKVRIELDYSELCRRVVREDTDEVVRLRALTAEEMQGELFERRTLEAVDAIFDEALAPMRAGGSPAPKLSITIDFLDGSAADVAQRCTELQEPDDVRFARAWEVEGKNRKTVLAACDERWVELGGDEQLGPIDVSAAGARAAEAPEPEDLFGRPQGEADSDGSEG